MLRVVTPAQMEAEVEENKTVLADIKKHWMEYMTEGNSTFAGTIVESKTVR